MDCLTKDFIRQLKLVIKKQNLSISCLAKRLGKSEQYIDQLLKGNIVTVPVLRAAEIIIAAGMGEPRLEFKKMTKYSLEIKWNKDDNCYVANVPELGSGFCAHGDTWNEAFDEINIAMAGYNEMTKKENK